MARSRRAKSQSISSINADPVVESSMPPPPSPPSPVRATPVTRRKAPSVSKQNALASTAPSKSIHTSPTKSISQFVVAVVVSLIAETVAQTAASVVDVRDLASISRRDISLPEFGGLLAWRITLMGIYWFNDFDAVDVASLNTLLQTPIFVLLHYFYTVSATTLLSTCTISILAPALPFYLFRPLSAPHSSSVLGSGRIPSKIRNRTIIIDPVTTLATASAATIIFTATLELAFVTYLPVFLVVHFNGLRDLTFAHDVVKTLPTLVMWLAPAGIASTQFLFRPAEGASSVTSLQATGVNSISLRHSHFNPATASFFEHVYHNAWGWYTSRQKELIGRTITLGTLLVAEIVLTVWGTVQGVEFVGALGYAGVWAAAVAVLGIFLDWVGGPSD